MALTAAQISQLYMIAGVPEQTSIIDATSFGGPYDPALTFSRDISSLKTVIDARLAALTASQLTLVGDKLTRFALIPTKPTKVRDTGGSVFDDYARERATLRNQISTLIGINFPAQGSTKIVR